MNSNFSSCYVSGYEIMQIVGKVAYELKLPSELASVPPIFHVSMLKKFIVIPSPFFLFEDFGVKDNFLIGKSRS